MKFVKYPLVLFCSVAIILASCKKEGQRGPEGPAGQKSLLDVKELSPGEKCGTGGLVIKSGIDKNGNNELDASEVDNTQYVCNGSNATSDKQIIIRLGSGGVFRGQQSTTTLSIPKFNINNYPGIDSIIIYAAPWGGRNSGGDADSKTTVELFNITDNTIINGSSVTAMGNLSNAKYSPSNDFYASFPNKEFDLGIKVTAILPNDFGYTGDIIMVLYRK